MRIKMLKMLITTLLLLFLITGLLACSPETKSGTEMGDNFWMGIIVFVAIYFFFKR